MHMGVSSLTFSILVNCSNRHFAVDSLIAVEIRNWVLKELKSDVSVLDILSALPIHTLALKISTGSKFLPLKLRVDVSEAPGTAA